MTGWRLRRKSPLRPIDLPSGGALARVVRDGEERGYVVLAASAAVIQENDEILGPMFPRYDVAVVRRHFDWGYLQFPTAQAGSWGAVRYGVDAPADAD